MAHLGLIDLASRTAPMADAPKKKWTQKAKPKGKPEAKPDSGKKLSISRLYDRQKKD